MRKRERPSDHGGDGGYEHRCVGCNHPFHHDDPPAAEKREGDFCLQCVIALAIPEEFHKYDLDTFSIR